MLLKLIKDLLRDAFAASGFIISIQPMDYVNAIEKSLAGLGGLIMLYYSIQLKILLIKEKKKELEEKKKLDDETPENLAE